MNQKTQETVHLAILQDGHAISIEMFASAEAESFEERLSGAIPLHCTGVGKALLAFQPSREVLNHVAQTSGFRRFTQNTITSITGLRKELERVREQGYAVDLGEVDENVRCVAARCLTAPVKCLRLSESPGLPRASRLRACRRLPASFTPPANRFLIALDTGGKNWGMGSRYLPAKPGGFTTRAPQKSV